VSLIHQNQLRGPRYSSRIESCGRRSSSSGGSACRRRRRCSGTVTDSTESRECGVRLSEHGAVAHDRDTSRRPPGCRAWTLHEVASLLSTSMAIATPSSAHRLRPSWQGSGWRPWWAMPMGEAAESDRARLGIGSVSGRASELGAGGEGPSRLGGERARSRGNADPFRRWRRRSVYVANGSRGRRRDPLRG
jgi:hypothetical protein